MGEVTLSQVGIHTHFVWGLGYLVVVGSLGPGKSIVGQEGWVVLVRLQEMSGTVFGCLVALSQVVHHGGLPFFVSGWWPTLLSW